MAKETAKGKVTARVQKTNANVSTELVQELFEQEFETNIAPFIDIESFEVSVERAVASSSIKVSVEIYGTAGAPTIDDFKNNTKKIAKAQKVSVTREDIGTISFALVGKETTYLNSNDYIISYVSE